MTRKPQPAHHVTWTIYRAGCKAIWLGEVETADEREAIVKAAKEFKQEPAKLIAVLRR